MLLFEITGYSDSDWAKDPDTRRSVSGWSTFVFDSPILMKSKMIPIVALSVTEAERLKQHALLKTCSSKCKY
jgi:hypothetical protein